MDRKEHIVKIDTLKTVNGTKYFAACSICKVSTGGEPNEERATTVLNREPCDKGDRLAK